MKILFPMISCITPYEMHILKEALLPVEIVSIRLYAKDCTPEDQVVYLLDIRKGSVELEKVPLNLLLVSDDPSDSAESLAMEKFRLKSPGNQTQLKNLENVAVLTSSEPLATIYDQLEKAFIELIEWDASFDRDILHHIDTKELFARGKKYIPLNYSIVDHDMNVIYDSIGRGPVPLEEHPQLDSELFNDLIIRKEFHETTRQKGTYYFYVDETDLYCFFYNIRLNDQFIAWLALELPEGGSRLSKGMEELFSIFARHVQDIFAYGDVYTFRNSNDDMHRIFHSLVNGDDIDESTILSVLGKYGWEKTQTYIVAILRFYPENAWDADLEMTLPYLSVQLENACPGSCAISTGKEISLILNREKYKERMSNQDFLQQIAAFVRDKLCKAGVSPVFSGFSEIRSAILAADAALSIGSRLHPDFWYYRFDELRLPYIINELNQKLPSSMLSHPAIQILKDYDRDHGSELAQTLDAYLRHNQNMTAAAKALFIHRTTFCRRLAHIQKLTKLNLDDPDTVLILLLSYRLA